MSFEYTEKMTVEIKSRYVEALNAGADYDERSALVKEIAAEYETSENSVRGKLVAEKVYVGKPKTETVTTSTSKEQYVSALHAVIGKAVPSFGNASRKDLAALWEFITKMNDAFTADEDAANQLSNQKQ